MSAREHTQAIGLASDTHQRVMALVDEVASANEWAAPAFHHSRDEVGVRPFEGAPACELWIQRSGRVVARPGIAPQWPRWSARGRHGWTWRKA